MSETHVQLELDNTTAVSLMAWVARQIMLWFMENEMWVSATLIPGSKNVEADQESHVFHDNTEWPLNPAVFPQLCEKYNQ